ncbi:MAG: SPFH domain-containing protein [Saprospiraceae bacterium]|nr:SPFH domain-containing protein [Saprospiraceae bacterium]MCB0542146.1 SPFH domain-containing protein [Saprospiraceae bacterium]MCB0573651.1 SPFH domain-containing protein [Saprospiraceae bacterium]MCB9307859.1 SPFH domain-containing protein [Lewinellaceae bacterium]MCB9353212.1 SPFH domain-containing protein [Lewinellaceae bacterium]
MEKTILKPTSGWFMLVLFFLLMIMSIALMVTKTSVVAGILILVLDILIIAPGFMAIEPNSSRVMTLFGSYVGSIRESGFFYANPFYAKKKISLRAVTLDVPMIKVNDKQGNPIMIGSVVVYRVSDTFKAAFAVEHYPDFVKIQSEAAVRKLAGMYSYDNLEDEDAEVTLRSGLEEVNHELAKEISERLFIAGIEVIEARINNLAYATEIAGAMLQRQQATAIVAARSKIVEGAVGMVEMALEHLSSKQIIELDEEKKAAMVSNLLVVLCGDRNVAPVVNTGTLHQ